MIPKLLHKRIENCDNYYRVIVGTFSAEKAYIFRYNSSNGEWNQHTILAEKDGQAFDRFGASVAVNEQFAIVGANYDDDTPSCLSCLNYVNNIHMNIHMYNVNNVW